MTQDAAALADPVPDLLTKLPAIAVEPAPPLDLARETALLEAALAREPDNAMVRTRLIGRLVRLDRFAEALDLAAFDDAPDSLLRTINHCRALFAVGGDGAHRAFDLLQNRLALDWPASDRARLLAERGRAELRLGQRDQALATLQAALAIDPGCAAAFKRLSNALLRSGDFGRVAALAGQLLAGGAGHVRLLGALAVAKAGLGQLEEARSLLGESWLPPAGPLQAPPPWRSMAELDTAAAAELISDPALRFDRHGTASRQTWRVDHPGRTAAPALTALLDAITVAVRQWIAALPPADNPWLALRPDRMVLRSWSVITGADGHEQWHMHPEGWVSGGYYLQVPAAVASGSGKAGCLAFGMPPGLVGDAAATAFGERLLRPRAGMLSLFPSHAYHRTYPHGQVEQRICLAFDLVPT